jgi:transposase-like protein
LFFTSINRFLRPQTRLLSPRPFGISLISSSLLSSLRFRSFPFSVLPYLLQLLYSPFSPLPQLPVMMADVISSITATSREFESQMLRCLLSPVEPSISSVRPETGSLPAAHCVPPSLESDLERSDGPAFPTAPRRKTLRPIWISKAKGQAIVELRKKGLSHAKIAKRLGLRTGGVRSFLRRRGLKGRQRIRPIAAETLKELYCVQGLSMDRIAKRIGMPHSNVEYWMKKARSSSSSPEEIRKTFLHWRRPREGVHGRFSSRRFARDARGPRRSNQFNHDSSCADCLVPKDFRRIWARIHRPVYNREYQAYSWQMAVALDDSFSFLLPKFSRIPRWIRRDSMAALHFVAGFFDAEGHITIAFRNRRGRRVAEVTIGISNSNRGLLQEIARILRNYRPRIHLSIREGTVIGPRKTATNQDQWKLAIYRREAQERLLSVLPMKHQEKVGKAMIWLDVLRGSERKEARKRVERLWQSIERDVAELAQQAREQMEKMI